MEEMFRSKSTGCEGGFQVQYSIPYITELFKPVKKILIIREINMEMF